MQRQATATAAVAKGNSGPFDAYPRTFTPPASAICTPSEHAGSAYNAWGKQARGG